MRCLPLYILFKKNHYCCANGCGGGGSGSGGDGDDVAAPF